MHLNLATNWFLDPIVSVMTAAIQLLNNGYNNIGGIHNLGLSLVALAALVRLIFWPLNTAQFKAMLGMQKIAPRIKKLQDRYKNDQAQLQQETMKLYKESGVNPLAGCWPMLIQLPVLFSVYWAVSAHKDIYEHSSFLWIGTSLATQFPKIFAPSLAHADVLLLLIYAVTQYLSTRFTTMPVTDPAQAQQMKVMQIVSPLMIGFFGFKAQWPSAMVLYWLSFNAFTMAQMLYMIRKYHQPLSMIDSEHAITEDLPVSGASTATAALTSGNGAQKKMKRKKAKG